MALTLLEANKLGRGTELQAAIVEIYAASSPILRVLPFRTIRGNALKYNREQTLPGVAFRGVNEGYTASTGILNPITESLVIAGGDIEVDKFILKTEGEDQRAIHEGMKIKQLAETIQTSFFKGDQDSDPKDMDGLQKRITGNQLIAPAAATSGGDALALEDLDELIDTVVNPTHLCMNKALARKMAKAGRTTGVSGYVTYTLDEFGRRVTQYNNIPILIIESSDGQDTVLPFTEANPGGGAAASTSVYCVSLGDGMVQGIQNGGIDVRDLGEREARPTVLTRIEWYVGMTIYHGRAASRLQGIKLADVTG